MARRAPSLGVVVEGTHNTSDLLYKFANELEWLRPRGYTIHIRQARTLAYLLENGARKPRWVPTSWTVEGTAEFVLDTLRECLEGLAPPFMYFGTADGDGACFGWWFARDCLEDLEQYEDTDAAREAKHVGEFYTVTDHGNVDIWCRQGNGRVKHILGVV